MLALLPALRPPPMPCECRTRCSAVRWTGMGLAFCAPADIDSAWHSLDFDGLRRHSHFLLSATPRERIQNSEFRPEKGLKGGKGEEGRREAGLRKAESRTAVTKQLSEDRIQNSLGLPAEFKPGGLTTHTASRIHSCRYI